MFTTIALLITSALGMLGWYFAWRARGECLAKDAQLMDAHAGESAAKGLALENGANATTAGARLAASEERAVKLQNQLDAERKSRQSLVDALAKSGHPVGEVVVDGALGRLYPDSDPGGPGSDPGSGGDPPGLSSQPAAASGAASTR